MPLDSAYGVAAEAGFGYGGEQVAGFGAQVGGGFEEFGAEFGDMEFRVPRPQVKLFGRERMDVPLLPPPSHGLDQLSDIQYDDAPLLPPEVMSMPYSQSPMMPTVPTPTAMIIKMANQPHSPLLGPIPQMGLSPGVPRMPPSPTLSRRSMVMPPAGGGGFVAEPFVDPRRSPLPLRRPSPQPSPQLSLRGGHRAMTHPPGAPQPMAASPYPLHRSPRSASPISPHPRRLQPQPSFREPAAVMPASVMPGRIPSRPPSMRTSPPSSPRASIRRRSPPPPLSPRSSFRRPSPPASPRGSFRHHRQASPPGSPRASMRHARASPSPPLSPSRPFGARRQLPPSPSRSLSLARSPSPQPAVRSASPYAPSRRTSPTPSRRSFAPEPQVQRPSSPTLSRRSTRLMHDPLPGGTVGGGGSPGSMGRRGLMRGGGRGRGIPMGTVKPLGPLAHPRVPTQNVPPFRTSVHSRHSLMHDQGASPIMSRGVASRRPLLPGSPGAFRNPQRPVGRGRPLMARQSIRRPPPHPGMPIGSPQPSVKHMGPPSPQLSVRHFSRPTSPMPSIRQGPPITMSPMSVPEAYPMNMPLGAGSHGPSPPLVGSALSSTHLSPAHLSSPLLPAQPYAPEMLEAQTFPGQPLDPQAFPGQPMSPMLSNAMQNPQIRLANYVPPLQPYGLEPQVRALSIRTQEQSPLS